MSSDNVPYLLPFVISMLFSLYIAMYAWRRREHRGAIPLVFVGIIQAMWTFGLIFESIAQTAEGKLFWDSLQWLPTVFLPLSGYELARQLTGKKFSIRTQAYLSIIPILFLLILASNKWTQWAVYDPHIIDSDPFPVLIYTFTPIVWIISVYMLGLSLFSGFILMRNFYRGHPIYRTQMVLMSFAMVLHPISSIVILILGLEHIPYGRDISPFTFVIQSLLLVIGFRQFKILDIVPVAYRAVFNSMDDGVFVLDHQARLVDINPAGNTITQQNLTIGQPLPQPYQHYYETLIEAKSIELAVTEGNPPQLHNYELRLSLLHQNEKHTGQLVVVRNITSQKQAEMEREQLIQDLDAYAHTVAHDLKNPITMIMDYATLLQESQLNDDDRMMTEGILHASEKMTNIINELLLLANLRQDTDIPLDALDTHSIIQEVMKRLKNKIEETQAKVTLPKTWIPALGYAPWVEEIWANYISNALKYGGEPPHIEVGSSTQADGKIRFWVRDSGRGLTTEEQAKLFHQFTRLQVNRKDSHGLGLSIVMRIAEVLGGEVGVESTVGQGSTFYFTLPPVS